MQTEDVVLREVRRRRDPVPLGVGGDVGLVGGHGRDPETPRSESAPPAEREGRGEMDDVGPEPRQ